VNRIEPPYTESTKALASTLFLGAILLVGGSIMTDDERIIGGALFIALPLWAGFIHMAKSPRWGEVTHGQGPCRGWAYECSICGCKWMIMRATTMGHDDDCPRCGVVCSPQEEI
jgi:hypothetical protein